jgi:O-antigen/teichoic acid export membrane protein
MMAIGGVGGGAELIVSLLYDPRYQGVVAYLRILSIGATLVLVSSSSEEMIIALGRLKSTVYATFTRLTWLALGTAAAFYFKTNTLFLVFVFGTVEIVAAIYWWTRLHREHLLDLREEAAGVLAACVGAAIGFGVSWIILSYLHAMAGNVSLHALLHAKVHVLH